jgi:hypothetical protein
MTVFGRDASNFDGTISYSGLAFFTHKATEGTSVVHDKYGARLNAARAAKVPVLGAYHVLRSGPSLSAQLKYWVAYLDAHTPWWRTYPHWIMQIDAEKWPYDQVSATTVKNFAALVAKSGLPGLKVTYASRGQYGDTLRGISTPLWNANYNGGPGYPGDSWTQGWAAYSGQTPIFLQYTDSPYDRDAYRGTLTQLLQLTSGGNTMTSLDDLRKYPDGVTRPNFLALQEAASTVLFGTTVGGGETYLSRQLAAVQAGLAASATREAAMMAVITALTKGGASVDTATVLAHIDQATAGESATVAALQSEVASLRTQLKQAEPPG